MSTDYRWIMYVWKNFPSNVSFDLERATSIEHARTIFEDFCRAVFTDECSATLYPYSASDWAEAQDFRDTTCPFDYPSRIIERGPRGGVRVVTT